MLGHQLVAVANPIGSDTFFSRTESQNRGPNIILGGGGGRACRFSLIFMMGFKVIRG